jgi:hypothetical protein
MYSATVATLKPMLQITIATSLTLRVGSMAEQTFNAVERVDEYCHLPEEAAYELSPSTKNGPGGSGAGGRRHSSGDNSGSSGAPAAAAGRKGRGKAGAGGVREPLLPVSTTGGGDAGSSSAAGPVVVVSGVPEGWPREGSIEFTDVKMRCVQTGQPHGPCIAHGPCGDLQIIVLQLLCRCSSFTICTCPYLCSCN